MEARVTETDDQLLGRARNGDRAAFGRLMERWQRPIFAYAVSLARNRAVADDVTQEVFLRAWRSVGRIEHLSGWLYETARRCAMEQMRTEARRPAPPPDPPRPDERQDRLLEAVAALPDDMRAVLTLKYTEGIACEEIARRLGRPLGTVTSLLSRAYHELRERMKR